MNSLAFCLSFLILVSISWLASSNRVFFCLIIPLACPSNDMLTFLENYLTFFLPKFGQEKVTRFKLFPELQFSVFEMKEKKTSSVLSCTNCFSSSDWFVIIFLSSTTQSSWTRSSRESQFWWDMASVIMETAEMAAGVKDSRSTWKESGRGLLGLPARTMVAMLFIPSLATILDLSLVLENVGDCELISRQKPGLP